MSRARRLRTPDGERWSCAAISVESSPATKRSASSVRSFRLEAGEGPAEVDGADPVGGIRPGRRVQRLADVHDDGAAALANRLAGLVRGDRHKPRPHLSTGP